MSSEAASSAKARLRLLAAEYGIGMFHSWDVPPVADAVLAAGVYSDAVRELACLTSPIRSEVEPLLRRALDELGLAAPSRTESIWLPARACVEAILAPAPGTDLHAGLDRLEKLVRLVWRELPGIPCGDVHVPEATWAGSNIDAAMLYSLADEYSEVGECFDAQDPVQAAREAERRAELDELVMIEARRWLERHPG